MKLNFTSPDRVSSNCSILEQITLMTVSSLHLIVTGTAEERARGVGGVMVH